MFFLHIARSEAKTDPGYWTLVIHGTVLLRFGRACVIWGICGTILMILPYIQLTLSFQQETTKDCGICHGQTPFLVESRLF